MEVIIKKMFMNTSSSICIVPKNIFNTLNLSTEIPYTIHFGQSTKSSLVDFSDNNILYLSEDVFNELNLLQDIKINIWKDDKDIFIGPVVGIFTGSKFITIAAMKKDSFYEAEHLIEAALAENCLSYFFTVNDIDLSQRKIKGFTFIPEKDSYEYAWFPLPEVIYVKNLSYDKKVNELIGKFKDEYNIQLINNCKNLETLKLCKTLCNLPETQKYVPETINYKNFTDVLSMLNKHVFIAMKSFTGKNEKEVLYIEKLHDKYKLNYYGDKENIFDNILDLKAFISNYTGKTKFIVQQGISLLKYKTYVIDLQLLMMKNVYGQWETVYKVVRSAKEDFNINDSKKILSIYEKIYPSLQQKYPSIVIPEAEKLDAIANMLAKNIEKNFGDMGEVEIDIGIDINGQIWITKANSEPVKNLTANAFDMDGIPFTDLVFKYYKNINKNNQIDDEFSGIFKYSKFLTGTNFYTKDTRFVKVRYKDLADNICYLTEVQNLEYCDGHKNENINIKFGSVSVNVKKVIENRLEEDSNILYLSESLKAQILIPDNCSIQILKLDNNHLEFGPLVGAYINAKKIAALSEGKTDRVYEEISSAISKLKGICCFFSIGDIDWGKKLVKGMIMEDSKWVPHIFPLPMVIYDRCFGTIGRRYGMKFRRKLGSGYIVINSIPKLAKLETIRALETNPRLIDAVPKTSMYESYKDIEEALRKTTSVYLKPDALYKGKGIFRISKEADGTYKVEHRTDTENEVEFLSNLQDIDKMINHYSVLGGGYLIQDEIKKASYKGYPFDFRLLYQKNWQGTWQPTGIAIRMGAPGSIITSPRSGGAVAEIKEVLVEEFQEDIDTENGLYEKIITIGREAALSIDAEFGDCVELGLDMTIDINRKVWIIEINGKPLKVSLKWLKDNALMSRCYARPIEYAVFLTGFQSASTDVWEV